jgi:hypothetical protein
MSETYYLLAAISYGIFIVQFILSWFGGDTDLDVDLDGELDMDVSDIVSFKGLVHFVMGASGWLCIKHSVSHSIEWYDYLIALICGILFVVILYYLYKLCLKLQHQVIPEKGEALVGRSGTITIPNDISGGSSVILVEINGMLQELSAYAEEEHKTYKNGDKVRISKFENGKYYFN